VVQKRLCGCLDLVAAYAIWVDTGMPQWFQMLWQWLESKAEADAELSTLAELHDNDMITEFSGGLDVYTSK